MTSGAWRESHAAWATHPRPQPRAGESMVGERLRMVAVTRPAPRTGTQPPNPHERNPMTNLAEMPASGPVDSAAASAHDSAHDSESGALTKAQKAAQGRAANASARKAATAARLAGIAARKVTGFRVGQQVVTNTPRSPRFHQRTGVVVGNRHGEVGVAFPGPDREADLTDVDAWFLPSELTRGAR